MFNNRQHLINEIHRYGLSEIEDAILGLAKPAVLIERTHVDEDTLPLGASKFSGSPDLPPDMEWPYWKGNPLSFIAQFKLSEISREIQEPDLPRQLTLWDMDKIPLKQPYYEVEQLPENGLLYFFYDTDNYPEGQPTDYGGWRVLYTEQEDGPFTRTPHPVFKERWNIVKPLPAQQISFTKMLSLPFLPSLNRYRLDFSSLSDEDFDAIYELYWNMVRSESQRTVSYIYGHSHGFTHIESECMRNASIHDGALHDKIDKVEKWQFLFQIASDVQLQIYWDFIGTLYICIPKTSLRDRRFEDCWTIMQCS